MTQPLSTTRRSFLLGLAVAGNVTPAFAQTTGAHLETNKAVVRTVIEDVQRDGNFANFEKLFAASYVDRTAFPGFASDREGTRNIYLTLRKAFPGFRATIHRQIAEGDLVTTHKTYHGKHLGEFNGVAPTGREIAFEVIDIMRVRNGQITDHWGVTDIGTLMRQISAR
jgi:predicted ester cyclase